MDRIDIQIWMNAVEPGKIINRCREECSADIAARVRAARQIQKERFAGEGIFTNSGMSGKMVEKHCSLDGLCKDFLEKLLTRTGLSARACTRILKLARTIADLDNSSDISLAHLSEAAGYRILDKKGF